MNTDDIMVNEEVVEVTEDIVNVGNGKGFKVAAGVGLAGLGGYAIYKFIVKPLLAKRKAEKEQLWMDEDYDNHAINDEEYFDED